MEVTSNGRTSWGQGWSICPELTVWVTFHTLFSEFWVVWNTAQALVFPLFRVRSCLWMCWRCAFFFFLHVLLLLLNENWLLHLGPALHWVHLNVTDSSIYLNAYDQNRPLYRGLLEVWPPSLIMFFNINDNFHINLRNFIYIGFTIFFTAR